MLCPSREQCALSDFRSPVCHDQYHKVIEDFIEKAFSIDLFNIHSANNVERKNKIIERIFTLKGIYPEFQVIRGFSQKIPADLLSYDKIHS